MKLILADKLMMMGVRIKMVKSNWFKIMIGNRLIDLSEKIY